MLMLRKILGFLEQSELRVSKITIEIVHETSLINDGCHFDDIL